MADSTTTIRNFVCEYSLVFFALVVALTLVIVYLLWKSRSTKSGYVSTGKVIDNTNVAQSFSGQFKASDPFKGYLGANGATSFNDGDNALIQSNGSVKLLDDGLAQLIETGRSDGLHHAHARPNGYADVNAERCASWDGSAAAEIQALVAAAGYLPEGGSYLERAEHYAYDAYAEPTVTQNTSGLGAPMQTPVQAAVTAAVESAVKTQQAEQAQQALVNSSPSVLAEAANALASQAGSNQTLAVAAEHAVMAANESAVKSGYRNKNVHRVGYPYGRKSGLDQIRKM